MLSHKYAIREEGEEKDTMGVKEEKKAKKFSQAPTKMSTTGEFLAGPYTPTAVPIVSPTADVLVADNTAVPLETSIGYVGPITDVCEPWSDPIRFPMILFVILIVLVILMTISAITKAPLVDRNGNPITNNQKWVVGVISIVILLIIAALFGFWIYYLSKKCQSGTAWLVFLLALLLPVLLYVVSTVIVAVLLGLNQAVWWWSQA